MSIIEKPDGGCTSWTRHYPARDEFSDSRGESYNCGSDDRFNSSARDLDSPADVGRTAAFHASLRDALRANANANQTGDETRRCETSDDARLLATAESYSGIFFPLPTNNIPEAPPTSSPDVEATVDSVMKHIEWSIRADIAPRFDQPLNIRVDFAATIAGVTGLTLTMTPTAIDVILERNGSGMSPELAQAAEALAKRLMSRFSKQVVRIFDVPSASAVQTSQESSITRSADFLQERDG